MNTSGKNTGRPLSDHKSTSVRLTMGKVRPRVDFSPRFAHPAARRFDSFESAFRPLSSARPPPTPPPPAAAPTRPAAGVTDSPAVADLKRKLDLLAAALVAAIAAILIRKFLRSLGEGEL